MPARAATPPKPAAPLKPAPTISNETARQRLEAHMEREKPKGWRSFTVVGPKKDLLIIQARNPDDWHHHLVLTNSDGSAPEFTYDVIAVQTKIDYDLAVNVYSSGRLRQLLKTFPVLQHYRLPTDAIQKKALRDFFITDRPRGSAWR